MYSQIAMKNFYFFAKANLKEGFALAQYKTVTLKFSFLQSKKRKDFKDVALYLWMHTNVSFFLYRLTSN